MLFFWHAVDYLFVYGTLRRGEGNHPLLTGRTTFAGPASCHGFLYTVEDRYPVLRLDKSGPAVVGELYCPIDAARSQLFANLDRLEGVDEGLYQPEVLEQSSGSWLVYTAGPALVAYCQPENRIVGEDWCRYRIERSRLGQD
ncbi:gamma-glutamylcyclotransferase family protein [Gloeobacter kilaueensis]|uniref:Gamma-glutamylcyclotransferase family protein n=1 Tax=Gloeobacter kilaueensis (strain ATCC BAA-2537 / CCAP 1431/1 / ULC 316 / JS1) TaxID=1183438 RepID=U5QJ98_GLOK1|nr:gamma-glutamylcyclotransferase family protein [Gloeobacter kilaueensis]AGY58938.1 AIG2 family protein [Gloeobacter kilaueensis JS1]